uniref:aldehyde dehydrogenase n=1 Tax=Marinobacterium profundum TaxID=1714300 RepID=UPI00082CCCFF|nr:aldehyde dehydrogenase [Marinobacterium profundum]
MNTQLVINNKDVASETGKVFKRQDPITGDTVSTCAAASVNDARIAAESAKVAFQSWKSSTPGERRTLLLKSADAIETKMASFVAAMKSEIGASDLWAGFNVMLAANLFREAAALTTQIQGETIPTEKPNTLSMTIRQPVGPCLSIAPWNGPVVLAARAIAYPLMCGNTVVFRASEISPMTHRLIAEAVYEAGAPAGVLNFITTAPDDAPAVIEALIADPAIRRVNFTGSTHVGRIIAEKCGRHLKRCLLELGDKSPLIVLDDANIDDAVSAAIFGSFLYQGQICMSTDRIIVDEKVADEFVQKFTARAMELPAGQPLTMGNCIIGPVISQESANRLNTIVDDSLQKGAKLVLGGKSETSLYPATIIDHVTSEMTVYSEETFGPVISIIRAKDTNDAINIANDTEFGLSAGVFGKDITRALSVAKSIETGSCHVNGPTVQNEAQAPYGGTKSSGYGRFDGRAVIDEFTELKWLTIEDSSQQYPF